MITGALFSGGKDSCLAIYKFGKDKIDCLLAMMPENKDSWMFHKPNLKLLRKQAEMLGIPLILEKTKGEKDEELEDLKRLIKKSGINKLVIGGIKSNYQGTRIRGICEELGVEVIIPLWDYSAERLWKELLDNGFKVIITKIACEGIPKEFVGKIIDKERFKELKDLAEKYKFRLDFEGGEAETAVLYMPGFKKEISLEYDIESEGDYRHFIKIKKIN
jgi:ABC transporter with metal-binding/Fe-S-binding domain ATP-binding protein